MQEPTLRGNRALGCKKSIHSYWLLLIPNGYKSFISTPPLFGLGVSQILQNFTQPGDEHFSFSSFRRVKLRSMRIRPKH